MKLFDGFALDMASDFTGLSKGEIDWLRKQRIVSPQRTRSGMKYAFSELLMLRLVRLLKLSRVPVKNIKAARAYLKDIDPSKDLTKVKLHVRSDTRQILYLGEKPQKGMLVNLNQYGQLQAENLLEIIPVGYDLEHLRRDVIDLDETLSTRLESKKLVPLEKVMKKYGLA